MFAISRSMLARVLGAALAACLPAVARAELFPLRGDPAAVARMAFDSPFGQRMTEVLGQSLLAGAARDCVESNGLDTRSIVARAGDLYRRYAAQTIERMNALLSDPEYQLALRETIEPEYADLIAHPEIQAIDALRQAVIVREVVHHTVQNFDRYLLINRVKRAAVSPLASGDLSLLTLSDDPETDYEDAIMGKSSPLIDRYVALVKRHEDLMRAAAQRLAPSALANVGPLSLFAGLEAELPKVCVSLQRD